MRISGVSAVASKSSEKISAITDKIHNLVVSILNEIIGQPSPKTQNAAFMGMSQAARLETSSSMAVLECRLCQN